MAQHTTPCFLFVDEDPLWLSTLQRLSRELPGHKCFAQSAEEALALIQAHAPSVLVSGYRLPGLDGLSLLEWVRAHHPRVACVLHTALPPELLRGARGIALVEKMSPPGTLLAALRALCVAMTG